MLRKIFETSRKIDIAFSRDAEFQSSLKLATLSTMPAIVFTSLWLGLSAGEIEYQPDMFIDDCKLQQAYNQSAAALRSGETEFSVSVDKDDAMNCAESRIQTLNAQNEQRNNNMRNASLVGLLLLYFTITSGERAARRLKELDNAHFFDRDLH